MYQSQHNGTSVTNRDYTPVLSPWNQTPAADQLEMNVRFTSLYNGNIAMMSTNMLYLQEAQNIVASQPVGLGGLQKSHMVNYYKYDQLQRITRMQSTFPQSGNVSLDAYYEAYQYDFNGNIRSLTRNNSLGTTIDALAYKYQTLANNPSQLVSNRLLDVADASMNAAGFKGNKAALNTANQYEYDADGNLTHDAIEGITITWNATGKVSSVTKTDGTYMQFTYDGMGNRISKLVKPAGITKAGYELYVRDAGGNILASYRGEIDTYTPHTTVDNAVVQLETHYIYGSNRIGQNKNTTNTMLNRANIHYELTNHLGNVLVVVTANKLEIAGGNYIPEIVSTTDYTPFGMQMDGRSWNSSEYKFAFQGQESENELYGAGDASFFKYRISDNRLGRFFSIDPLAAKYPHNSSYAFSENRVIDGVELEGLEVVLIHGTRQTNSDIFDNNTINQIKNIFGNTYVDKTFSWGENSWLGNSRNAERYFSAIKLMTHVVVLRQKLIKEGAISKNEPITLVGYSHGGNVALQAIDNISKIFNLKINLLTIATPAYNDKSSEDPSTKKGLKSHIHIYSEGDGVDAIAGGDETYNNKTTINLKIGKEYIPHTDYIDTHSAMGDKKRNSGIGLFLNKFKK